MNKLLLLFFALLTICNVSAQETVRLTVSGQGATKEEATANALRSAIEQSFGVFVSANTQILNDEVVKDEIATIASGNIKEFKELGCITLPDGDQSISLSATVSIGNLISYAKSKGSSAEFAGQVFAMNMKMRKLNAENERKALMGMFTQMQEVARQIFDWEPIVGEPIVVSNGYKIPISIIAKANSYSVLFYEIFHNTLNSLSLKSEEINEYKKNGMATYQIDIFPSVNQYIIYKARVRESRSNVLSFTLRNNTDYLKEQLNNLMKIIATSSYIKVKASVLIPYEIENICTTFDIKYETSPGRMASDKIECPSMIIFNTDYGKDIIIWNFHKYKDIGEPIFENKVSVNIGQNYIEYVNGFECVRHTHAGEPRTN